MQAEANSFELLAVVVTDMTRVSSLTPAAHPNMSKISVRASQVGHLKANPPKFLREITAVYRQNYTKLSFTVGRDSSVGIPNGYGLGGTEIEFRWGRGFPHLSGPGLGPTQPRVQWVLDVSWG